jgi:pentatricopeptide repeat protein
LREDEDPETVAINERISQFASRKQLREVASCFEQALQQGLANQYTYSCTMNAYVRCGDVQGAAQVFQQSRKAGHPLEVVSCTTMIKGYCEQGDLATALKLIDDMEAAKPLMMGVPPLINLRTVNTYLRGCIGAGAVEEAVGMLERLIAWKLTPDASSFDYVIGLLAQGLQLERAGELLKTSGNRNCLSAMQYLSVVRAAVLLGQWKEALAYLNKAEGMLTKDAHATGLDTKNHKQGSNTGGKRARKEMA